MWPPALDEQIRPHQQEPLIEEITIMSLYGDTQFIQAETDYRFERGRTAPWVAGRVKSIRHRMPMRRTAAESLVPRHRHAA
jgi:hypothetical protein